MSNDITYSFRDVDGGVIVASGDVVVKKNFSGTIIAGGTITIEGDVTVTGLSDTTDIIKLIRNMQRYSRYGIHLKTVMTAAFGCSEYDI